MYTHRPDRNWNTKITNKQGEKAKVRRIRYRVNKVEMKVQYKKF